MLELFIVVSDDLIIYEPVGVNLIYIFREFTKSGSAIIELYTCISSYQYWVSISNEICYNI